MLNISRRLGEQLTIENDGEKILIKIVSLTKGIVKLGIEAPTKYQITRHELPELNVETSISRKINVRSNRQRKYFLYVADSLIKNNEFINASKISVNKLAIVLEEIFSSWGLSITKDNFEDL